MRGMGNTVDRVISGSALTGELVELALPADTRWVRLARLLTSGVGAAAEFDVEEIEDFVIAVDEVCATLIERVADRGMLRLRFKPELHSVVVEIEAPTVANAGDSWSEERVRLSEQILSVVLDDCQREIDGELVRYRLTKAHALVNVEGESDGG
jgi:hypothetical protein